MSLRKVRAHEVSRGLRTAHRGTCSMCPSASAARAAAFAPRRRRELRAKRRETRLIVSVRDLRLHKGLHPHRTLDTVQPLAKEKAPISGAFAEPSDGLEPSTPSLP